MTVGDGIQVASTAFAAIAALGSAGAALIIWRQWTAGLTPAVSVDVSVLPPNGILYLTIANYGVAVKKVSFAVIEGSQACVNNLPVGFLAPGQTVQFRLGLELDGLETTAVALGFDLRGRYIYGWAANGKVGRWRLGSRRWNRKRDLSTNAIVQSLYPDAPKPTSLEQRPSTLIPPDAVLKSPDQLIATMRHRAQ